MKIVVLGAGVMGVSTAYFLAKDGHEVVVLERNEAVAQDASGGNAGLIAPGHSFAWASPAAPKLLLQSLAGKATAIRVKPRIDPRLIGWGVRFLRECTPRRAESNTLIKLRLCQYSQGVLDEVAAAEGIEFDHVRGGVFYLYRDRHELDLGMKKMKLLQDHGQEQRVVSPEEMEALDPVFKGVGGAIAGAVHGVTDASGNSEKFSRGLADRCRSAGVKFVFGSTITGLTESGGRIVSVVTDQGPVTGDAFVLALGIQSPFISRTVGQRLPVYPAKGYSLTAEIKDPDRAPTIAGVDEKTLVAWSRMGNHLRMSSTAEFAGYNRRWTERDFSNITAFAKEMFPGAADWDRSAKRACLRPMTPDGPPIIGTGKHPNLYYNTGHGHIGWTMACGSARLVADLVAGRSPEIDTTGLGVRQKSGVR